MGKKVTQTVYVTNPDTNESLRLNPGDEVPKWAEDLVTNPGAFEEQESIPEPGSSGPSDDVAGFEPATESDAKPKK